MLYNVQLAATHMSFLLKGFKRKHGIVRLIYHVVAIHSQYTGPAGHPG